MKLENKHKREDEIETKDFNVNQQLQNKVLNYSLYIQSRRFTE